MHDAEFRLLFFEFLLLIIIQRDLFCTFRYDEIVKYFHALFDCESIQML